MTNQQAVWLILHVTGRDGDPRQDWFIEEGSPKWDELLEIVAETRKEGGLAVHALRADASADSADKRRAKDAERKRLKRQTSADNPQDASADKPSPQTPLRSGSLSSSVPIPSSDQTRARGNGWAMPRVGAETEQFTAVWNVYRQIRGENKHQAATQFQIAAETFPGGQDALRDAILAALKWQRPLYLAREHSVRKALNNYIADRKWEDERPVSTAPARVTDQAVTCRECGGTTHTVDCSKYLPPERRT